MSKAIIWQDSTVDDVTGSSKSTALDQHATYLISVTTDIWFKVDETGGSISAGANGTHFLASGDSRTIAVEQAGSDDSDLALYYIQDSEAGKISISKVTL